MADIPHFDIPFRIDPKTGHLAEVEQGTLDEIAACVEAICRTERGERDTDENFGLPMLALTREPLDLEEIAEQIAAAEPRALTLLEQDPDLFESSVRSLRVNLYEG